MFVCFFIELKRLLLFLSLPDYSAVNKLEFSRAEILLDRFSRARQLKLTN